MKGHHFRIKVSDPTPFAHKPISYPPGARQWLKEHMASLERLGVATKLNMLVDDMPTFTCSVVLVPEG